MMFGIYEDDGEPMRDRTFDDATRNCIQAKFVTAWLKANPSIDQDRGHASASQAADEFTVGLETFAAPDYLMNDRNIPPEFSKKRRIEKLTALANALESLKTAIEKIMPFDLMDALYPGMIELQKRGIDMPNGPWVQAVGLALRSRSYNGRATPSDLEVILDALRRQIEAKDLRELDGERSMRLEIADEIVNYLRSHNITATTSSTGLAGMAFEATFELAGLPPPKAGYWIAKAKKTITSNAPPL